MLEHAGLVAALAAYCAGISQCTGDRVTCTREGDFERRPETALCLYRIAQEALRNVVTHARARHAEVRLVRSGDNAELTIADDGQGFDVCQDAQERRVSAWSASTSASGWRAAPSVRDRTGQGHTPARAASNRAARDTRRGRGRPTIRRDLRTPRVRGANQWRSSQRTTISASRGRAALRWRQHVLRSRILRSARGRRESQPAAP